MMAFCQGARHAVRHLRQARGRRGPGELPAAGVLAERADANGVPARLLTAEQAREYEPEVSCVAALRVESTGIISYRGVCEQLVADLTSAGADLRLGTAVTGISASSSEVPW